MNKIVINIIFYFIGFLALLLSFSTPLAEYIFIYGFAIIMILFPNIFSDNISLRVIGFRPKVKKGQFSYYTLNETFGNEKGKMIVRFIGIILLVLKLGFDFSFLK